MSQFKATWFRGSNGAMPIVKGVTTVTVNQDDVNVLYHRSNPRLHPANRNQSLEEFNKLDIESIEKMTKYSPLDVICLIGIILFGLMSMYMGEAVFGLIVMCIAFGPIMTMKTQMLSIKLNDGRNVIVRGREEDVINQIENSLK